MTTWWPRRSRLVGAPSVVPAVARVMNVTTVLEKCIVIDVGCIENRRRLTVREEEFHEKLDRNVRMAGADVCWYLM